MKVILLIAEHFSIYLSFEIVDIKRSSFFNFYIFTYNYIKLEINVLKK